jgi:hypothetical protein
MTQRITWRQHIATVCKYNILIFIILSVLELYAHRLYFNSALYSNRYLKIPPWRFLNIEITCKCLKIQKKCTQHRIFISLTFEVSMGKHLSYHRHFHLQLCMSALSLWLKRKMYAFCKEASQITIKCEWERQETGKKGHKKFHTLPNWGWDGQGILHTWKM